MTGKALPYSRWDFDVRHPFFKAWRFVAGKDFIEQGGLEGSGPMIGLL